LTESPEGPLPDPELVRDAAVLAVEAAPEGWRRLRYILWFSAPGVADGEFWIEDEGGRTKARPPRSGAPLLQLRQAQIDKGQPGWQRCDLILERETDDMAPTADIRFSYESGDTPE